MQDRPFPTAKGFSPNVNGAEVGKLIYWFITDLPQPEQKIQRLLSDLFAAASPASRTLSDSVDAP